ncbi:MAG: glycosyltransferase family 2 protein [Thermodesulfobacteriota bacterium]|nr:glycosyltransferase family 2 protein [Thermodesulfobacteriota bacterium]
MASSAPLDMTHCPHILAIIVTWNKKKFVLDLLKSLDALDYPPNTIDILVVDNASNDGTAEAIASRFADVRIMRNEENLGGSGGFNTGLSWAFQQSNNHYKYLWLLDNDVLVHRKALSELITILEKKEDVAVAGSTMIQMDFPWRINEMGGFVDRGSGALVLNRHGEEVPGWRGRPLNELLAGECDLTNCLMDCRPYMDTDYVAAASLLVRADVAKEAGLWKDFFIHFDDVEWCLRIGRMGWRVVTSARSIIWHLSAVAKVPTWVLYYDNRNVLYMLKEHGADSAAIKRIMRRILIKSAYYSIIGKPDLGRLHVESVQDFLAGRKGKKDTSSILQYRDNRDAEEIFLDPSIHRILIPWSVNLQATGLQEPLVQAAKKRTDLEVHFLISESDSREQTYMVPLQKSVILPGMKPMRWYYYLRYSRQYDLLLQSDYMPLICLSFTGKEIMFVNDEGFCRRSGTTWKGLISSLFEFVGNLRLLNK